MNARTVELLVPQEGFSGDISLPLLPDLIQIYTISRANGALTIRRGDAHGTIWFEQGEIVHAVCGDEVGEEAVYRLLQWHDGRFSLDAAERAPERSITASWQKVLMEGCRRLDEGAGDVPSAPVFVTLAEELPGLRAAAMFDAAGAAVAQHGDDLAPAGPLVAELFARQARVLEALSLAPAELLDCCWILGEETHFLQPLAAGRVLHLVVTRPDVNLALIRRAVERVSGGLGAS